MGAEKVDLRSKLNLYKESIGNSHEPVRHKSGCDVEDLIPGSIRTNEYGCFYLMEKRYPLFFLHGEYELGDVLQIENDVVTSLGGESCSGLQPERLLFLDTETTGLSGGAGTVAFLVGVGFFDIDNNEFVIQQYFMRDYNEEAAMLAELKQLFAEYEGFVTFNGKAFDINLLQSRFISNRLRPDFRDFPNLDLLFPSRRIWGLKLESCRLSSLEENILGLYREDDIPGALIPSVYFKYVEDRNAFDIKRVISHNELDILSMVSLLARLSTMMGSPFSETDGGFELLGMSRLFEASGKTEHVMECLEACTESELFSVRIHAVKKLTGLYKRRGSYDRALEHWKAIEAENPGYELFHLVEMAKYYEHNAKDPEQALELVEKALKNCLQTGLTGSRQLEELKKRRDRLIRKCRANKKIKEMPGYRLPN